MLRRLASDRGGGIATTFAIAAPVLALLVCGSIDLAAVSASRSQLQSAADAAALNAAHQLDLTDTAGVASRAEAFVRGELGDETGFTFTVETEIAADRTAVTVSVDGNRPSFFANLLPPGGWNVHVSATAKPMARRPLCVLTTSTVKNDDLILDDRSNMTAPDCMVSSNAGITVKQNAQLAAAAVQSTLDASGPITPTPLIGAPQIADPFASLPLRPESKLCQVGDILSVLGLIQGTFEIPAGVHCGDIKIGKNQKIKLLPGEHYFLNSKLVLDKNAELSGEDVVIIFDKKSDFHFSEQSSIRLKGRRSGVFAGFVIATTRENTHTFKISSDNARELLGSIYVPNATLEVDGERNDVAEDSAWTVILAKSVKLKGSARLVVNADYKGSGVPVPKGVGPLSGVAMTQ